MKVAIAILLWSAQSYACKCDPGPVQQMYNNPIMAATAFVGKSEGRGKNRVFKVVQSWTPFKGVIKAPATSKCSLDTRPGHTYLIYSLATLEQVEKRKIGFTICDSFASEIDDAEPIIEKLADKPANNDVSPNPSWFYCTDSKDCVTEKGVCSDAIGVNKKFRERMKLWALKTSENVNCISSQWDHPSGKVFCKNYFCEAEIKPPPFVDDSKLKKKKL
jgi:hypothetical protein